MLVFATGSSAVRPADQGIEQPRHASEGQALFVFRTLDDCDRMIAYAPRATRAAVIGGGLLGLEAARGLLSAGSRCTSCTCART